MTVKTATGEKTRLTREDWIGVASRVLREENVDAVRIERLADLLKATRGSFYWHFKDRAELLDGILAGWRQYQTSRIIERLRHDLSLTPIERVVRLRSQSKNTKRSAEAAQLELAVRSWARHDKLARKVVLEVDRERIAIAETFLADAGMSRELAASWAFIGYAFTVGSSVLGQELVEGKMDLYRELLMNAQFPTTVKRPKNRPAGR